MIKEAIKFLTQLGIKPGERVVEVVDADNKDRMFFVNDTGGAYEVQPSNNRAQYELELSTLTGLVSYIKSNLERKDNKFFLHVINEKKVILNGLLESDGGRELLVVTNAIVPRFNYEYFHDAEELNIALQSTFVKTEDRDIILQVIGNIKEENVQTTGDDGISQAVTIKTGLSNVDDVIVPNPVKLAPYRTFLEVEQPASDFIFRMKDGPRGAIFEADGGAWRNEAITNVRDYLEEELKYEIENGRITIIA